MAARRYRVRGRVQGVFFRASTCERAREIGLRGWVRNLPDGRVEVVAEGEPSALEALEVWLRQGPPMARVDDVTHEKTESPGEGEFRVLY